MEKRQVEEREERAVKSFAAEEVSYTGGHVYSSALSLLLSRGALREYERVGAAARGGLAARRRSRASRGQCKINYN